MSQKLKPTNRSISVKYSNVTEIVYKYFGFRHNFQLSKPLPRKNAKQAKKENANQASQNYYYYSHFVSGKREES